MVKMHISKDKPYYHLAVLLASAAGSDAKSFTLFYSYPPEWRNFACWFWSNIAPEHDPAKKPILDRVNSAQGIDLEDWYWSNQ